MDWPPLLKRRLDAFKIHSFVSPSILAERFRVNTSNLQLNLRMMVVKTIINSWTTSDRFHENTSQVCLFGCVAHSPIFCDFSCNDELAHYLRCPILWRVVGKLVPLGTVVGSTPLERLGLAPLVDVPGHDMRATCIAYWLYHYVKNENHVLATHINTRDKAARIIDLCCNVGKQFAQELF